MNIRIFQIDPRKDAHNVRFMCTSSMKRITGSEKVDWSIYDLTWQGEVDCKDLDEVYMKFNVKRPADFQGHSLSVSDVIEVVAPDKSSSRFWFVDQFGFREIWPLGGSRNAERL